MKQWTQDEALDFYSINRWGAGFFTVNQQGNLSVLPERRQDGPQIDLAEVIHEMQQQKIAFPAVIRFHDILRSQVKGLNQLFQKTIEKAKYQNHYRGVYPIKVNQMREVVEEVVDAGAQYHFGLEAGTKAELLAVLAYNTNPGSLTILNGHKDQEFMQLALLGQKLGHNVIIVIEKLSELTLLLETAQVMKSEPTIGIRAKLTSRGSGRWADSGGESAKFGLSISEILQAVELLNQKGKLDWLKLFHFHIGSQITDIKKIKECLIEGSRIYCKLSQMGVPLTYFDAGGGVGVDYDGTRSASDSSVNYSLKDYVENVVYILQEVCDGENVSHPIIVTEIGRALTAHHSCVVTNVFGHIPIYKTDLELQPSDHLILKNMQELLQELSQQNFQETYNEALVLKDEGISSFKLGFFSLQERAQVETLFWKICHAIDGLAKQARYVPDEIQKMRNSLSEQYLCNMSVFQSIPDSWAIDQVLPIVPISRLHEEPTVPCTLADITCDSDGKIEKFIPTSAQHGKLMLHSLKPEEEYTIGIFLTGAYQDVMGDMHNMLGRLNEVHVFTDDDDPTDFYIEEVIPGNTSAHILSTLQYNPHAMAQMIKKVFDKQIQAGKMRPKEAVQLADFYEQSLQHYTYLKNF